MRRGCWPSRGAPESPRHEWGSWERAQGLPGGIFSTSVELNGRGNPFGTLIPGNEFRSGWEAPEGARG